MPNEAFDGKRAQVIWLLLDRNDFVTFSVEKFIGTIIRYWKNTKYSTILYYIIFFSRLLPYE